MILPLVVLAEKAAHSQVNPGAANMLSMLTWETYSFSFQTHCGKQPLHDLISWHSYLYSFCSVAITNYNKLGSLKHHPCIISQLWGQKACWSHQPKNNVLVGTHSLPAALDESASKFFQVVPWGCGTEVPSSFSYFGWVPGSGSLVSAPGSMSQSLPQHLKFLSPLETLSPPLLPHLCTLLFERALLLLKACVVTLDPPGYPQSLYLKAHKLNHIYKLPFAMYCNISTGSGE